VVATWRDVDENGDEEAIVEAGVEAGGAYLLRPAPPPGEPEYVDEAVTGEDGRECSGGVGDCGSVGKNCPSPDVAVGVLPTGMGEVEVGVLAVA